MLNKNTQDILSKYGVPVNGRDIQLKQPKITINNYNNNQTTNNVDTSSLQAPPQQNSGKTEKLKSWLSGVFDRENEDIKKRQREYDLRQSGLEKSSNSLLRKLEGLGKDIAENMSPQVMGTTLKSQLYTLIFLFLGKFLAKHFEGFMNILTKVGTVIKHGLSYFGIIKDSSSSAVGSFKNDFISFFGGQPGKDNLGTLFKRIFNDAVDALFMYLQDGMEERAYAIKHIEFPKIIDGNIGGIISGLGSYLGQILEAITDPDTAMRKSTGSAIKSAGFASAMQATNRDNSSMFTESSSIRGLTDTSLGDYAITARGDNGQRRYSLLSSALDSSGDLKNNDVAEISQSMDLIGAFNDASSGKIDVARVAQGFQQLQDNVDDRGSITVDKEFLQRTIGNNQINSYTRQGLIRPERYKFVQADKSADSFTSGLVSTIAGNTMTSGAPFGLGGPMRAAIMKEQGYGKGMQMANNLLGGTTLGDIGAGVTVGIDKAINGDHNHHKLVLVPDSDPRPAAIINGVPQYKIYYKVGRKGLNAISNYLFGNNRNIDQYDKNFLQGIRKYLLKRSSGKQTSADFNISDLNTGDMAEYNNMKALHRAKEAASMTTFNTIGNNAVGLINNGINAVNGLIGDISGAFNNFASSVTSFNGASSYGHPRKAIDRGYTFNVGSACAQLNRGVFYAYSSNGSPIGPKSPNKSDHHCAMAVRKAIEAGGISTAGRPGLAFQYVDYLPSIGFQAIEFSEKPQAGDIVTINRCQGHSSGHICMYNGQYWVSDFVQRTIWVGLAPVGVMFRHIRITNADPGSTSAIPEEFRTNNFEGAGGAYSTPYDSSNSVQGFTGSQSGSYVDEADADRAKQQETGNNNYIPNIKSPFKTPKEIEMDKIKGEAADLWTSGDYLNNLYKKYGNNSGAQDYINYYSGLSKTKREEEKNMVERNNFAMNLFKQYGSSDSYAELFGTDPKTLARILKNLPKEKWDSISKELSKTVQYENSVKSQQMKYTDGDIEDEFSDEKYDNFFNNQLINNLDIFPSVNENGGATSENPYGFDIGTTYNNTGEDRKTVLDYYNALVKGDTNTANKIILDHIKAAESDMDKDDINQYSTDKQNFLTSAEMLKSKVMFGDKYEQYQGQLQQLEKAYDQEQDQNKKMVIGYQMQQIQAQMAALGRNSGKYVMDSTSDSNDNQRNAQIRDLQNQEADINAKRAAQDFQREHRGEILAAKFSAGQFKPGKYETLSDAIDKYMKEGDEEDKKTSEQLDKDLLKIKEADKKRGLISAQEYGQYYSWLANPSSRDDDLDDFKQKFSGTYFDFRTGQTVNGEVSQEDRKKQIEAMRKKYGNSFENWFFDDFQGSNKGYYGKATDADFKFSGKLERGKNESDADYGQRLRRLLVLGRISKDKYNKEMSKILDRVNSRMLLRDSSKDRIGSSYVIGKGEDRKYGWIDDEGGKHEVDALGNETYTKPTDQEMLNYSVLSKVAKVTGESLDQIKHSQQKARIENGKWASFVEENQRNGISYKEQAVTFLTQASQKGISINLPDNITKDADGNWVIPDGTTVPNQDAGTANNQVKDPNAKAKNYGDTFGGDGYIRGMGMII